MEEGGELSGDLLPGVTGPGGLRGGGCVIGCLEPPAQVLKE